MARAVQGDWVALTNLKKALPVIVRLKNGSFSVLSAIDESELEPRVVLIDPHKAGDTQFTIDRARFEDAWAGDIVMLKRDYSIKDEEQPFSLGLISSLIFRERRTVRDVAICAFILSAFALAPIIFWRLLSDRVLYYKNMNTFAVLCIAMVVIVVFESVFAYLRRFLVLHLTTRIDVRLSEYVFQRVLHLPMGFFERTPVGRTAHDLNEVWKVRNFLTGQLFGTVLDSMTLLFFLPVMFLFSPALTFTVLGFCGIIVAWIVFMLPGYRRRSSAVIAAEASRGAFLIQTLQGMKTVKSMALEVRQAREWDIHVTKIAKLKMREGMFANVIQTGVQPLERLITSGTYALGVYFAVTTNDPIFIGALFAFLLLSQRVAAPLMQMAQLIHQYDEARSAVAVVGALVNQPEEEGRSAHGVRAVIDGFIQFSKVRFWYPGAVSPALDGVSFEIPKGTTLGVVGRSGSGKTTVTRLLQRLHSDYEGLIKIDGIDVREYDLDHLRRSLGVVLQENYLFSGTIRENIAIAKRDASFEDVVKAARLAGAEEFIDRLPRGYETYIYEGSPNLSGGQRQRLAIARALILDPRILILDEATSALDPESEAIVNANIGRIARGRTVIVISHRLSSLVNSDNILVLEQGGFHALGPHSELLKTSDIYSELWHQQNGHIADASSPKVRSLNRVS